MAQKSYVFPLSKKSSIVPSSSTFIPWCSTFLPGAGVMCISPLTVSFAVYSCSVSGRPFSPFTVTGGRWEGVNTVSTEQSGPSRFCRKLAIA